MGILDNIKQAALKHGFLDEGPIDQQVKPVVEPKSFFTKTAPIVAGASDPKIVEILRNAIKGKNIQGPDYLELKDAIEQFAAIPMTEELKAQAAFATLKGISKEKVLSSIDFYKTVADEQLTEFKKSSELAQQKNVETKKSEIEQKKRDRDDILKNIQDLQRAFEQIGVDIQAIEQEVSTAQNKIDAANQTFITSLQYVKNELENDKNNFNKFLK